eukprot:m.28529 g.28529  ORF g.28529 m.28529 type:complete len:394 (+) comp9048_c0_seq1:759-1940(+)
MYLSDKPDEEWDVQSSARRVRWAGRMWEGKFLGESQSAWTSINSFLKKASEDTGLWEETISSGKTYTFVEVARDSTHVTLFDLSRGLMVRAGPTKLEFMPVGHGPDAEWLELKTGHWADDGSIEEAQQQIQAQPCTQWNADLVGAFLHSIHCGQYQQKFKQLNVDGPTLQMLSETDLECELGVTSSVMRKRILGHLERFKPPMDTAPSSRPAGTSWPTAPSRAHAVAVQETLIQEATSTDEKARPLVFLSYSWANQSLAREIRDELEKDGDVSVWMDIRNMGGGDNLLEQIDRGIRAAALVVCCVSKEYAKSSFCRKEVMLAESLQKPMLCVLMEPPTHVPWPPLGPLGPVFAGSLYVQAFGGGDAIPTVAGAVRRNLAESQALKRDQTTATA